MQEVLSQMREKLSLEKSVSSADKLSTPTKKSATSTSTIVENTPILARTKVPAQKRPPKFVFKMPPSSSSSLNVGNSPILVWLPKMNHHRS